MVRSRYRDPHSDPVRARSKDTNHGKRRGDSQRAIQWLFVKDSQPCPEGLNRRTGTRYTAPARRLRTQLTGRKNLTIHPTDRIDRQAAHLLLELCSPDESSRQGLSRQASRRELSPQSQLPSRTSVTALGRQDCTVADLRGEELPQLSGSKSCTSTPKLGGKSRKTRARDPGRRYCTEHPVKKKTVRISPRAIRW